MNGILLNQSGAGAVESVNGQIGEVNLYPGLTVDEGIEYNFNSFKMTIDPQTGLTVLNTGGALTDVIVQYENEPGNFKTHKLSEKLSEADLQEFSNNLFNAMNLIEETFTEVNEEINALKTRIAALETGGE